MICNRALELLNIGGCAPGVTAATTANGGEALAILLARLFRASLIVGGLALLLYLAWGGIRWVSAGSDKGKVEEAQHQITNAVIGMAVLVATIAIVLILEQVFGFSILNPSLNFT